MNGTRESQRLESAPSASPLTSTKRENLTQERVRDLFDYRDGKLFWKTTVSPQARRGCEAGSVGKDGYRRVEISRERYFTHRLVWLWHYGYLPENDIDHINRIKLENYVENLREVGRVCNARNRGNPTDNTSGVKGVGWFKCHSKWRAQIAVCGRVIHLGIYRDFLEAVCVRLAAEQALDWNFCDSCSPAFQYVRKHISHIK